MQTLKVSGDPLEEHNLDLLEKISDYEEIWSKYIGNNGCSEPMNLAGINDKKDFTRKIIWQYNHSIFRNLLILGVHLNVGLTSHLRHLVS